MSQFVYQADGVEYANQLVVQSEAKSVLQQTFFLRVLIQSARPIQVRFVSINQQASKKLISNVFGFRRSALRTNMKVMECQAYLAIHCITPVQVTKFHRGQRYHILPVYAQDGIILSRTFQGSTDALVFGDYIEELLHHCGRYPAANSILVMDIASFHRSQRIKDMCLQKGVQLIFAALLTRSKSYRGVLRRAESVYSTKLAILQRQSQSRI